MRMARDEREREFDRWDQDRRKQWAAWARDPGRWFSAADRLLANCRQIGADFAEIAERHRAGGKPTSEDIRKNDDVLPVYLMLAGFAVENLLKGLLVLGGSDPVRAGGAGLLQKDPFQKHDLEHLAREAGFELKDADEVMLVRRLTLFAVWGGRYPVPLAGEGLVSQRHAADNRRILKGAEEVHFSDWHGVEVLVHRIWRAIEAASHDRILQKLAAEGRRANSGGATGEG